VGIRFEVCHPSVIAVAIVAASVGRPFVVAFAVAFVVAFAAAFAVASVSEEWEAERKEAKDHQLVAFAGMDWFRQTVHYLLCPDLQIGVVPFFKKDEIRNSMNLNEK
jgi:hypothetical protein